ncbi:MAG: transglutaminase-like cysteine peptidase [Hydrogenophilaceae bacterium]|nr:transglutaminase-like cysteine peptidase [Hydrogenophilaceae bacterium]
MARDNGFGRIPPPLRKYLIALTAGLSLLVMAGAETDILPDGRTLELARANFGSRAAERLQAWRNLTLRLAEASERDKLERINRFFNGLPNVDDLALWGQRDYWATPVELLVRNGGDCEDFALAKYFTLKAAGVPAAKLRVTYARVWLPEEKRMESHMVLAYYPEPDAEPLILDNLVAGILPASRRTDLSPTMSFNAAGLWSAKQRGQAGRIGDTASIRHWNDLLERMSQEHMGDKQ